MYEERMASKGSIMGIGNIETSPIEYNLKVSMNIHNVFLSLLFLTLTVDAYGTSGDSILRNAEKNFKEYKYCNLGSYQHTKFKIKNEKWDICYANNHLKIITIKYFKKTVKYEESYFIRSGKFEYAFEQETEQTTGYRWNCEFAIINEKQATILSSLGHGKTEDENWDPDEIIGMYKVRIKQLEELEKQSTH